MSYSFPVVAKVFDGILNIPLKTSFFKPVKTPS